MNITVRTELIDSYLRLECRGPFGILEMLGILEQAFDTAAREGLGAILLDVSDVEGAPTAMDRYDLGVKVAKLQLSQPGVRIP